MWQLIVIVFCMLFYVDTIAVVAENRIKTTIIMIHFLVLTL